MLPSEQKDLFAVQMAGGIPRRVVLELKKIQVPQTLAQKKAGRDPERNFHVPSFKNSKLWLTKLPNGKPLARPMLITNPAFQQWMDRAALSLESQLISLSQTIGDATQPAPSKLFAMCSLLPADDSCTDLPEGGWKVKRVPPGEEGAEIILEML